MCAWQLGIDAHTGALDALGNLLEARGAVTATAAADGEPALVASFAAEPDLSLLDAVGAWLSNLHARDARLRTRVGEAGDWQESWRAVYGPMAVSERVGVYPVWAARPDDGRPAWVSVDPTPAFGAGAHPTTRVALRLLDACLLARPGAAVLDVGAGSGILAIAAAQLGSEAVGVEIDPIAVRAAQANALRNGVAGRARFMAGTVDRVPGPFDVVMANILPDIVCGMAAELTERATGELVVTAMPGADADKVLATFAEFELVSAVDEGQWRMLHLRRRVGAKAAAEVKAPAKPAAKAPAAEVKAPAKPAPEPVKPEAKPAKAAADKAPPPKKKKRTKKKA
ncbi:MAG: 50S ribosomal protein L11 methyltransferase [Myxococcota bacterium]